MIIENLKNEIYFANVLHLISIAFNLYYTQNNKKI